eukprot:4516132-Pyramimonas_sp.AAC.2
MQLSPRGTFTDAEKQAPETTDETSYQSDARCVFVSTPRWDHADGFSARTNDDLFNYPTASVAPSDASSYSNGALACSRPAPLPLIDSSEAPPPGAAAGVTWRSSRPSDQSAGGLLQAGG